MQVVDTPPRFQNGGRALYPWQEWMDGQTRKFVAGEDFKSDIKSFRAHAHKAAKEAGMKVHTNIDGNDILLHFYEPEKDEKDTKSGKSKS